MFLFYTKYKKNTSAIKYRVSHNCDGIGKTVMFTHGFSGKFIDIKPIISAKSYLTFNQEFQKSGMLQGNTSKTY